METGVRGGTKSTIILFVGLSTSESLKICLNFNFPSLIFDFTTKLQEYSILARSWGMSGYLKFYTTLLHICTHERAYS